MRGFLNLFGLISLLAGLSGCLGNGGGSDTGTQAGALRLSVSNNYQPADGQSAISLSVSVRDSAGQPLSGIAVALNSPSDSAVFEALSGTTDSQGRFSTSVTSSQAETFSLTATAGTLRSDAQEIVFVAPVSAIQLSAQETVLAADGSTAITVALRRAFETGSQPLPDTPFSVTASGPARLGEVPARSGADGQAVFQVTATGPGTITLLVASGPASQTLLLYAGGSLILLPALSNAVGQAKLTAMLRDAHHAPLAGQTVAFNFIQSGNETLAPAQAETGSEGTAEVTLKDLGEDGGQAIARAQAGQLAAQATVNFLAQLGQGRTLSAESSATVLQVSQSARITARVVDSAGLGVPGVSVGFSATGSAQASPADAVTDANGEATALISNSRGENVSVTVRAGTAAQTLKLYFGAKISLTPLSSQGTADSSSQVPLTASLRDASGAGIAGAPVDFRASGHALLDKFQVLSSASGQALVNVSNSEIETVQVTASAGGLTPAQASVNFSLVGSGLPKTIEVNTSPAGQDEISLNQIVTIVATVLDRDRLPVKDGTLVKFSTNGVGSIGASAFTRSGQASALFNPGNSAGLAVITASTEGYFTDTATGEISAGLTLLVNPTAAGIIEINKITPAVIGIQGSGVAQSARIDFLVKDSLGNPVKDGTAVSFSFDSTRLNGGETLSTGSADSGTATGYTSNGVVSVTVKSGYVAGNLDVIARAGEVQTVARLTVAGGLPDAQHFSVSADYLNIAGGLLNGLQDTITAYLGDRFGNVVADGTAVSFISEGGTIGSSPQSGAFSSTTSFGVASAILQSSAPRTPYLGGLRSMREAGYACGPPYHFYATNPQQLPLCGNPGFATIVAYTTGSESFADLNGNGQHDSGEPFEDISEPYLDANDNKVYDEGELYIDVSGGTLRQFDGPNGRYDANTLIWKDIDIVFSSTIDQITVSPQTFNIAKGASETFTVQNIQDIYGNPLVAGCQVKVTSSGGELGGNYQYTIPNANAPTAIRFTLASDPATLDDTGAYTYPPRKAVTLNIEAGCPDSDGAPGSNGKSLPVVISGTINN